MKKKQVTLLCDPQLNKKAIRLIKIHRELDLLTTETQMMTLKRKRYFEN